MTQRINYFQQSPELTKKLVELDGLFQKTTIETPIRETVEIRASQLNGCAFCVDMHTKMAKIHGERELRLHHVAIWRESTLFSPRERAALAWTEALTQIRRTACPTALRTRAGPLFREGTVGSHLPRGRHQLLEPAERRLPRRARLVRQDVRADKANLE